MSKETINRADGAIEVEAEALHHWAPKLTQATESYPTYWVMKGWKCVVSN